MKKKVARSTRSVVSSTTRLPATASAHRVRAPPGFGGGGCTATGMGSRGRADAQSHVPSFEPAVLRHAVHEDHAPERETEARSSRGGASQFFPPSLLQQHPRFDRPMLEERAQSGSVVPHKPTSLNDKILTVFWVLLLLSIPMAPIALMMQFKPRSRRGRR